MKKLLLILLAALSVNAANITWLGTSASAKTAANWDGGVLPAEGDVWVLSSTNNVALTVDSNFTNAGIAADAGYTATVSLQSYTVTITGDMSLGGAVIAAGTGTIGATGTAAQTFTTAGETLYDVTINRSTAGTCLFSGATSLHTLTVSATNTQAVSWTGTTMTASGNITLGGSGTSDWGTAVTLTGLSSSFSVTGSGAVTATSCDVTFNGTTACSFVYNKAIVIRTLTTGAGAVLALSGSSTCQLKHSSTPLILGAASSLAINGALYPSLTASGSFVSAGAGCSITGTSSVNFLLFNAGVSGSIPDVSFPGITVYFRYLAANQSFNLSAAGSLSCASFGFVTDAGAATCSFNTNGCSLVIANHFYFHGAPAISLGASVISVGANFDFTVFNYTGIINLQTAQITVSGNYSISAGCTFNPGASIVRSTPGAGATATVTSNGKHFATFRIVGNATGTVSLGDSLQCDSAYVDSTGLFNQNSKVIYARDYYNYSPNTATMTSNVNITRNFYRGGAVVTRTGGSIILDTTLSTHLFTAGGDSIGPVVARWIQFQDSARIASITTPAADSCVFTLKAGAGLRLTTVADSSLNGTAARLNYFVSSTPGTQARLHLPAAEAMFRISAKDISSVGYDITANNGSSLNGGNNSRILFMGALSSASSPRIDTVARALGTYTHVLSTGAWDSLVFITALPGGYAYSKTTGTVTGTPLATLAKAGYIYRAYGSNKTDSVSAADTITIIQILAGRRHGGALNCGLLISTD